MLTENCCIRGGKHARWWSRGFLFKVNFCKVTFIHIDHQSVGFCITGKRLSTVIESGKLKLGFILWDTVKLKDVLVHNKRQKNYEVQLLKQKETLLRENTFSYSFWCLFPNFFQILQPHFLLNKMKEVKNFVCCVALVSTIRK